MKRNLELNKAISLDVSKTTQVRGKTLEHWKESADENYDTTPISVLKYITVLEEQTAQLQQQLIEAKELNEKILSEQIAFAIEFMEWMYVTYTWEEQIDIENEKLIELFKQYKLQP